MLQLTPQTRILVATEPVDFRRGIDGLVALCRSALDSDPFLGTMFVFSSRSGNAVKVLYYDSC
jgi:transposase